MPVAEAKIAILTIRLVSNRLSKNVGISELYACYYAYREYAYVIIYFDIFIFLIVLYLEYFLI